MTRMIFAASSASGSWQYLLASTKQASASWTFFSDFVVVVVGIRGIIYETTIIICKPKFAIGCDLSICSANRISELYFNSIHSILSVGKPKLVFYDFFFFFWAVEGENNRILPAISTMGFISECVFHHVTLSLTQFINVL